MIAFAAYLALPLFGLAILRLTGVRTLDLAARLALAGAAGVLSVSAVLSVLSVLSIPWSRTSVFVPLAAIAIAGFLLRKKALNPPRVGGLAAIAVIAVLFAYGLFTARITSGDLHFFWGPKSILFYQSDGVTIAALQSLSNKYMNPDYPLLLPLVYAWSQIVARQFSWWAALAASGLFLFASVMIVRSASRDAHAAVLMAAALGYAVAKSYSSGAAEPLLLLFEIITLCALVFIEDERTQTILAALGLIGAAATKIEGATFSTAVVLAILIVRRDWKLAIRIGAPAAVVIAGWMAFVRGYEISLLYTAGTMPMFFSAIPIALTELTRTAGYGVWGLPWIAAIALIVTGDTRRAAALPIVVSILTIGAAIFFYIHMPDPRVWIAGSGPRVLLTPLCALLIAAAASHRIASPDAAR